jgi:hypothetical protein
MRNIPVERFIAANVIIEFEDGLVRFCILHGATLAGLSENVDSIGHQCAVQSCRRQVSRPRTRRFPGHAAQGIASANRTLNRSAVTDDTDGRFVNAGRNPG